MVHGKNTEMIVSVIMVTYGHEKYIEEAINGVFIQQTDFPVELIIANDCSPDQTDKVVKSLLPKSPENVTVKYTKHEFNKGANNNFNWAASQATGKYIALCEGDDYWTDPLKLQKQVEILENSKDISLVHTGYFVFNETKKKQYLHKKKIKNVNKDENYNYIHTGDARTLTCVFRKDKLEEILPIVFHPKLINNPFHDRAIFLCLSSVGKVLYLPDVTGVYRMYEGVSATRYTSPLKKYRVAYHAVNSEIRILRIIGFTDVQLLLTKYFYKYKVLSIYTLLKMKVFSNLYLYLYNSRNKEYSKTGYV